MAWQASKAGGKRAGAGLSEIKPKVPRARSSSSESHEHGGERGRQHTPPRPPAGAEGGRRSSLPFPSLLSGGLHGLASPVAAIHSGARRISGRIASGAPLPELRSLWRRSGAVARKPPSRSRRIERWYAEHYAPFLSRPANARRVLGASLLAA